MTLVQEGYKKVDLSCPICHARNKIKIPCKIIDQNRGITTVSIPKGVVCKHSFQVYIDNNFWVRGYQKVDFEISTMEFYESLIETEEKDINLLCNYNMSVFIQDIINILRQSFFFNKNILGGAIFTLEGKVLYSSLSNNIFFNVSKAFENYNEKNVSNINQLILIFNDQKKIISEVIHINDILLVIIVLYSSNINLSAAQMKLGEILNQILCLDFKNENQENKYGNYWIYSQIDQVSVINHSDKIRIKSLGMDISKSVIRNLNEIKIICKNRHFEGKIFFDERYVKLMEGLAPTLKDAAILINNLNKIPE